MAVIEELEPLVIPSGFWCSKESPDYSRCGVGDYTAQTCPNATGPARMRAAVARLKAEGLWCGTLGASLAAEAKTAAETSQPGIAEAMHPNTLDTKQGVEP